MSRVEDIACCIMFVCKRCDEREVPIGGDSNFMHPSKRKHSLEDCAAGMIWAALFEHDQPFEDINIEDVKTYIRARQVVPGVVAVMPPPTPPAWKCRSCGHRGKDFHHVAYPEGDFDVACPKCGSTEVNEK